MTLIPFHNVAAFVLAGGASERMGQDKALLELGGVPMVMRAARLAQPYVASVAIVAPQERYAQLDLCASSRIAGPARRGSAWGDRHRLGLDKCGVEPHPWM